MKRRGCGWGKKASGVGEEENSSLMRFDGTEQGDGTDKGVKALVGGPR
jgi:hypothetical protein